MKVNKRSKFKSAFYFIYMIMLITACSDSTSTYTVNKVRVTSAETKELATQTKEEAGVIRRNKEEMKTYLNKE